MIPILRTPSYIGKIESTPKDVKHFFNKNDTIDLLNSSTTLSPSSHRRAPKLTIHFFT